MNGSLQRAGDAVVEGDLTGDQGAPLVQQLIRGLSRDSDCISERRQTECIQAINDLLQAELATLANAVLRRVHENCIVGHPPRQPLGASEARNDACTGRAYLLA